MLLSGLPSAVRCGSGSGRLGETKLGVHAATGAVGFLNLQVGQAAPLTGAPGGQLGPHGAQLLEQGGVWDKGDDISLESSYTAGSVYVGVESFLGPIFLGYGMAEGGHDMFYLQLGTTFQ